jgi:hypothetical protein
MYGANYGYRSSLNQSMVRHLQSKVELLLTKVSVHDYDVVLDIGSNDGTLLSSYPQNLLAVGMDPTAAKFREFYKPHIQVIPNFFSYENFRNHVGNKKVKIITSIAMFYDLEDPISFVSQIEQLLEDEGIWHFEQSYMPAMLHKNAYDTICHEHLEYYGLQQIIWITKKCGLKILDVELNNVNGGSFAVTLGKVGSHHKQNAEAIDRVLDAERASTLNTLKPYADFRQRVFEHREKLNDLVTSLASNGARVLGYGASTKGNVVLQFCGITPSQLPFIADVNPDKFGAFTPGTNIPIISEAEAHTMNPDCLLVLPWHFRDNLLQREAAFLRRGGKMIFPLPGIEVVSA